MKYSVMITFIIVILGTMGYAGPVKAQTPANHLFTLKLNHVTLRNALSQIENQSNYKFVYADHVLPLSDEVSLDVKNQTLQNVLDKLLKPYPVNIEYSGTYILIKTKVEHSKTKGTVTGRITDAGTGEALVGVTIRLKGTAQSVSSDANGGYNIPVINEDAVLVFSYIGFTTKEIVVGRQLRIDVKLESGVSNLNQVVVIGYGTQEKANITSSIATVKMTNVDQGATFNAVKMLEGRAPGVNIITPAGTPGTPPIVLIRGVSSISGGSQPLYVVDGLPNETFPNINPNDIESMEVLKDASASAIYGSRANNGVIIITTKSGKSGKTQISLSAKYGIGSIFHDIKMANSQQYVQVMQAATDNYNAEKGTSLPFYKPDAIQETDWVKEISRPNAINSAVDVSISGGGEKTKYFTSFGSFDQQGILKTSDYKQYNMRFKLNLEINKFMALNVNISGAVSPQQLLEENNTSLKNLRDAREEQPWYSPYLDDGTYKINGTYILRHNPVMEYKEENWTRSTYEGLGRVSLDITPAEGLKYTPSISTYSTLVTEQKKLTDQMAARRYTAGWGALQKDRNLAVRYVFDNILSYTNHIADLNYTALIGHSYEKYNTDLLGAYSSNYANGAYPSANLNSINAGPNIYPDPLSNDYQAYNLESYLSRLTLDYKGKYLLNASIRRDGSSRFAKEARYGNFPSLSLGWRLSKESFWKENNVLTDFKIRMSYGVTASLAGIGNYSPLSLVSAGNAYNNQGSLILSQDAQNVTWEKAKQFDIGFDAQLLKGRVNFTFDYYNQKTSDLLYNKPIYSTSGYTSIPSNIGSLGNQGLEFSVDAKILTGKFKWNTSANISFIKNKLLSLYSNSSMYVVPASGLNQIGGQLHALINGEPVSTFFLLKQTGIYQYDNEVPAKLFAKGVRAGDVKYQDINGDGDITDADRQNVGKATPDYYGGFNNTLSWKGFELNIFSQFSVGNKVFASWRGVNSEGTESLGDALSNVNIGNGIRAAQFYNVSEQAATTYWHGPGTSNTMPRPVRNGVFTGYTYNYNLLPSTRQLENGSYFKLKTVTLGYNLPQQWIKQIGVSGIRIYCSADNLLTLTKYSGYDPEQSFATSPGDANYGVDFGLQAALRTYLLGINVKF